MHEVATQSTHAQTLLTPGLSILDCADYRINNHINCNPCSYRSID